MKRVIKVSPYCRHPPTTQRMQLDDFNSKRDVYQRNYAPRGGWTKGVSKDLIDSKALKDSTLTRRENNKNIKQMFNFKNIM